MARRRRRTQGAAVLLSLTAAVLSGAISFGQDDVQTAPSEARPLPVVLGEALDTRLVELLRAGIETTDPHGKTPNEPTSGPPFDGSWDWHSSVIAHWALLVRARTSGDEALRDWVLARVTDDVIVAECSGMRERAGKRLLVHPYDEGWFCLFLSELATHRPMTDAVRELRTELEGRLLDGLETRRFPENVGLSKKRREAGEIRYCGFYQSSMLLYLLLEWSDLVRDDAAPRLAAWRAETLEPHRQAIAALETSHGYDFLWPPAILSLVDMLSDEGDSGTAASYLPPEFSDWPEEVTIRMVHILGLELCRVWPLAARSRSDPAADQLYRERVESLLARPDLWSENFKVCSHWIPQFLFIGEWLRAGRP